MVLAGNGPQLHRPAPDKSVLGRKSLGWTRRGAGHRCPETAGTRRAIPASPSRVPGPIPGAHPTPPVAREVMPPDPGFRAAEAQDPYLGRKRASPSSPWGRAWAGRGTRGGGPLPGSQVLFLLPPRRAAALGARRKRGHSVRPAHLAGPKADGQAWDSVTPPWSVARGQGRGPARSLNTSLGQTHFAEAISPRNARCLPPNSVGLMPQDVISRPAGSDPESEKKSRYRDIPADTSSLQRPAKVGLTSPAKVKSLTTSPLTGHP